MSAQGGALGGRVAPEGTLQGFNITKYVTPFQGSGTELSLTQGSALGWNVTPLRGGTAGLASIVKRGRLPHVCQRFHAI